MTEVVLNVFKYSDFRKFLLDFYHFQKSINRTFSQRYISQQIGASSAGWFSDLVKGRINLTGSYIPKLLKLLKLKPVEADYFEVIVHYQQSGSHEEKLRYFDKMMGFKEVEFEFLGKEQFNFYSEWYHAAIREALIYYNFKSDYKKLGQLLSPQINAKQAKESIELLKKLSLIQQDERGYYKPTAWVIRKDPNFKTMLLHKYHKTNLELAFEALNSISKNNRDISALTLGLSEEAFIKATNEVKKLRKKLLSLEKTGKGPVKIFQTNLQLFPISQPIPQVSKS